MKILWEFELKTTRNSKGKAGFYAEVFSWGEEFPAADSLKFMTGDTNQASPSALTLSSGARVYADADGQNGTVKVRAKYSNGTNQPKTFTPKFGLLSGVGESDALTSAYHHKLRGSTHITATCWDRSYNEPAARVDGVDYQDIGKAVEAFNLSSRETSTFELLKDVTLSVAQKENPPVYTLTHSGVVNMNGKVWEMGSLTVKPASGKVPSVQFEGGTLRWTGPTATFLSNAGGSVTLDGMTMEAYYDFSHRTNIYTTDGQVTLRNSNLKDVNDGILAAGGTVTLENSQVSTLTGAWSAVRTAGNAEIHISNSDLAVYNNAAVDLTGGGTLNLSGNTALSSMKGQPQIDLGGSGMLDCGEMNKPAKPYRLRAEFDAESGFRVFTQNWGSPSGRALADYFVNTITADNGSEVKIIPGGHFVEKDGEAVIQSNSVTLNAGDGKIAGTEDKAVTLYTDMAGKLSELPTAALTGRTFAGWYSADGEHRYSTNTVFSEPTTAHAVWGEAGISVTLDYNKEGGITSEKRKVVLGKTYQEVFGEKDNHPLPGVEKMTQNGYTFDGWYTAAEGGEKVTDDTVVTNAESHTLYAHWKPNEYTMTIANLNGGTLPEDAADSFILTFGETYPTLPTPTKAGYRLASWRNQYGTPINAGEIVDTTYDQTLTALWVLKTPTYNVTLDPGEDGRIANGQSNLYSVSGGKPYGSIPSALRNGYTFDGWWTQEDGGERITSASIAPLLDDAAEAPTLYAHWIKKSYTVTFYDGYKVISTVIVSTGDKVPEPEEPTKTGFTFNGWRTQRYGAGDLWDFNTPVTGSFSLYTHWTSHILTVYLNLNGGSLPVTTSDRIGYDKLTETTYDNKLPTPKPPDNAQEFLGWYTAADGGDLITAGTTLPTADHTVYAHWGPRKYAVTFDPNGGECATASMKADEDGRLAELPTPTRSGYNFEGWFTAKTGGEQLTVAGTTLTKDVTAYARWARPQYTVEFDLSGGTMADTTKTVTCGGAFGTLPNPRRIGYRFTNWWYEPEGGEAQYITESTTVPEITGATITLTAHWSPLKYIVTLDANGGAVSSSWVTVQSGLPYGELPTPTRTGYTFSGWYTAADDTGEAITADSVFSQSGNQTLYAHWTVDTYTVNFIPGTGGSVTPTTKNITYGGTYGTLPIPTQAGKTFVGWYTTADGGKQVTRNTPVEYVESKTVDLYAHWRTTHTHPVGESGTDVDFVGVISLSGLDTTDGKAYFLQENITVADTIGLYSSSAATVTICLNGKTITGPADKPVFNITGAMTLRICDCQGGGVITLADGPGSSTGIIYENSTSGGLHLYGGTITGNKGGCGVYVGHNLQMYGGAITGNKTTGNGGGVYVYNGNFILHGGVISGNTTGGSGGGVGAWSDSATANIHVYGGSITGNTAKLGGGVFANHKMTMTGGSISGNTATESYGGAYSARGIAMTGGEITGNKAPLYGGFGVVPSQYVGQEGYGGDALVLGGTAKIIGNTTTDGAASNLYLYAAQKDGNADVDKLSVTIDTDNPPEAGAQIGITSETAPCHLGPVDISKASSGDYSAYFVSDDPGCSVQNSGEGAAQTLQLAKFAPQHQHPFCGPDDCGLESHASHGDLTYQPLESETLTKWQDRSSITLPEGNYFLTEDITLENPLTISNNATVNLCLNGHTITGPGGSTGISISSGSALHLCDCVGGGKLTNFFKGVSNYGTFELYGGEISGNGAGVDNTSGGTFTMCGGVISENTNTGRGGGISNAGTFELYGGVIRGNKATGGSYGGGGVYNSGTFTMHGGSISGNAASSSFGGGVHNIGTFTMNSGVISGNTSAKKGGGVHNSSGSVTITGGEITGNSAVDGGGLCNYGTAVIQDVRIVGNTVTGNGGGVYHYSGGLTVSGNTVIRGNTIAETGAASNVYLDGNEYSSGSSLSTNSHMSIGDGGLGTEASIGVGGALYTASAYKDTRNFVNGAGLSAYADRFFCDDEANSIWADGDYLWLGTNLPHSHAVTPGGEVLIFRDLPSGTNLEYGLATGTYRLSEDTSVTSLTLNSNAVVTLCLNGHTLTTKSYNKPAFTVPSGATLNICDCQGGGKIMRTPNSSGNYQGAHVQVSGTLNLYGGSITGNNSTSSYNSMASDPTRDYGGGVRVEDGGQFNMYGGSITNNVVKSNSGGGVYVATGGTFTMHNGEISGNTSGGTRATDGGGGVYVADGGTASLLGGVITGNTATAATATAGLGGGVYAGGSVIVGGSAVVQGNLKGTAPDTVASNVYLPTGQTITVSEETPLEVGAKIGVTTQTAPTDSAAVNVVAGGGTGLKDHFTSDNDSCGLKENESGSLQLIPSTGGSGENDPSITPPDVPPTSFTVIFAYSGSDGQTTTTTLETNDQGKLTGQTLPTPEREGYLFGGWYLDEELVTADTKFTDSATVTAQWTLCDHAGAEKTVTTAATCSAEGQTKYTCPCGASWTETIDILDHAWGQWMKKDENQHTRTCSVGKETQTESHDWAEDAKQRVEPTCAKEGKIVYACSVCSAEKTETLPVTSHNYSGEWKKDASGHWQACADCETPAAAQKHLYTEEVTQPTCDTAGTLTLTCSVCGYAATEAIPALGHSFKSQWEKDSSGHWHVCARDNTHTSEKLAHSWDGGTVLTPATTTEKGTTQYTCIDCGQTKTEQDIPVVVPVTYTLTYTPGENASGEDIIENGQTTGESVTLPTCSFTRTGYAFTGWECGGSTYQAGDAFTVLPSDVTFTAQWELNLPITLQPGDTVVLEDGASVSRSDDGTAVTIRKNQVDVSNVPDGAEAQENTPETTVTVPAGETVTLMNDPVSKPGLDEDGNETTIQTDRTVLEIPGGSKVQTKSDDPEIAIPEGATAKVTMNGDVYDLPTGTTVTQGDSTITVGTSGGSVSTGGDVTFDDGEGQVTVQNGEEVPVSVTVPKDGGVSVTPDENTKQVGGRVTDSSGTPVENAVVELRQGNTVYGKATTDSSGNYTFLGVYPGVYDLVVSESGKTLTKLVEITGEAPIDSVTLTDNASVLTIVEGTNLAVVVGGLDTEADAQKGSITMTVEQKEEAEAVGAENIRNLVGEETVLDYLDVKVEKGGTILTETETALEIILPFEFANVEGGVTVYRYHSGTAQALTESEDGAEGTFCADPENGMIRVYASKFSTYALGYAKPYAGPEVSVAPGETKEANDGTTVTSKENEDGTVAVTITYPDGGETNIVLPEDGDKTVILNRETGEVTVPTGSTVNTEPAVTLPQGGTVDKNGNITVPANGTVTVTDGANTTTITPPSGGAVTPGEEGGLHVPAGSTVQTGDRPVIILPESGEGGTVFPGGAVCGTPVQVDGTTITISETDPSSGDIITSPDGEVTLPGGTTANVDENGDDTPDTTVTTPADGGATVKPDGEIYLPKGGTVTQSETIVTVPTTGGTVGKEESGETTVPGGSTVQTGEAGKPVTLPQGGKVDESGNVTGESVKVGDTTVTATDPDKPVTVDPTGSTTIPAGAAAEVEQGGTTTTVTPSAGGDATVKPDGEIDLPAGGEVTIPGESGKPDTTVTVGEGGGTVTPDPDGAVEVPGGSAVQTGTGPVITLPESGGGGTVNKGGDVTVPIGGSATVTDKDGNETTVTPGVGGDATVKPDGEIDLPAGGKVTVADGTGGVTEVTAPTGGGTVSTDQNGNLVVPGGSTVTKADGTTETVPKDGGIVKPDGTVEQKPTPSSPPAPSGGGGTAYPPVIEQPRYGKVTVSPADPQSGDKVTITVTPEKGWKPGTVTVTDSSGRPVEVTKDPDGTYSFIQPDGEVTISAVMKMDCSGDETCPIHAFTDVSTTAWYHDGVHYCIENGLMAGLGNGKFGPNNTLTRGMLAQILYNKEGRPAVAGQSPFEDVKAGTWYANAVIWAAENNIVAGYGNGRYGPNDPITREQLATILWRYAVSPESTGSLDTFIDGNKVSNYAVPALQWAVEQKIVSGKGNGILDPRGKATRAEVATMVKNYFEKK